jgi:hypothetical protein
VSDASVSNLASRDMALSPVICRDPSGTVVPCATPIYNAGSSSCENAVIGVEMRVTFRVEQSKLIITGFHSSISLGTLNFQPPVGTSVMQIPQSFSVVFRNVFLANVGKCNRSSLCQIWKPRIQNRIASFSRKKDPKLD